MLASIAYIPFLLLAAQAAQTQDPKKPDLPKVAHQADLDGDTKLGADYSKEVEKELKLSTDEKAIARVQRIGGEFAAIANNNLVKVTWGDKRLNPFNYTFKVVQGEDINAFSLPGGFIYIYDGLLKFAESDDELAGVIAHEVAHASFRHVKTMERERSKLQALTLPLILISIFGSGSETTASLGSLGQLITMAKGSGWSVNAERAADYGAVQYMIKSNYSPVGMLTFMERLAKAQRAYDVSSLGIFQTHPPSRERATSLVEHLEALDIPIRRSLVSSAYRVAPVNEKGNEKLVFEDKTLTTFTGKEAPDRAKNAASRLNEFFDTVPDLFEVTARADGTIVGRGRILFQITEEDAKATNMTVAQAGKEAVEQIKRSLYTLAFRVWDTN